MKNKLVIIPVLLIVALILAFIFTKLDQGLKESGQIKNEITHFKDTTTHWRDDFNREHAMNISFQQDLAVVKLLHDDELNKASDMLKVKQKQIENLNKVIATIHGSYIVKVDTVRRGDTIYSTVYKDSFSTFQTATIGDQEAVTYNVQVPIHLTQYWKRPHSFLGIKFGDPVHYIDGWSDNKNVTLDSLSNVRILTKPAGRWCAGPVVGLMTTGGRLAWSMGIGITYSLIRW